MCYTRDQRGYFPELDLRLVVINAPPIVRDVILDHLALFDPLVPGIEPRIWVAGWGDFITAEPPVADSAWSYR